MNDAIPVLPDDPDDVRGRLNRVSDSIENIMDEDGPHPRLIDAIRFLMAYMKILLILDGDDLRRQVEQSPPGLELARFQTEIDSYLVSNDELDYEMRRDVWVPLREAVRSILLFLTFGVDLE